MSWTRREAWTDDAGTRWRAQLDRAGLQLRSVLPRVPDQWRDGWLAGPVPLDDNGAFAAAATAARRLEITRDGIPVAEVWAHPERRRSWRLPAGARAHQALHGLRARGYPAPRPLGWLAPRRGSQPSFSMHAPLPAPSVAEWLRSLPPPSERRALRSRGVDLVRRLAADGLLHPGLGAERVRWVDGALVLTDLEGMQTQPGGVESVLTHLACLADDPALAAFGSWDRARFAWGALRGVADRRRWFRRALAG